MAAGAAARWVGGLRLRSSGSNLHQSKSACDYAMNPLAGFGMMGQRGVMDALTNLETQRLAAFLHDFINVGRHPSQRASSLVAFSHQAITCPRLAFP